MSLPDHVRKGKIFTAVVDAARRWPALAEPWVRSLTKHYREHT